MDDLREKVIKGANCCITRLKKTGTCGFECPYKNNPLGCKVVLLRDVLSIAEEQEPRVMTLEEVKCSEIVFIEEWADPSDGVEPIIRPCIIVAVKNGFLIGIVDQEEDLTIHFFLDQYGIDWRCWTARPTEEQQEETPWN